MALRASGLVGKQTLREVSGCTCDLCGKEVDSEVSDVTALDCSFQNCDAEAALYHQACLEKFLKAQKCERNRKIGFPCPRGHGRGTKYAQPCPGKILKSHPVCVRGEANKKRRQELLEQLAKQNQEAERAAKREAEKQKPQKAPVIKIPELVKKQLPPKSAATEAEKIADLRRQLQVGRHGSSVTSTSQPAPAPQQRAPSPPPPHQRKRSAISLTEFITGPLPTVPPPPPVNAWASRASSFASIAEAAGAVAAEEPAGATDVETEFPAIDEASGPGRRSKEDGSLGDAPGTNAWTQRQAGLAAESVWQQGPRLAGGAWDPQRSAAGGAIGVERARDAGVGVAGPPSDPVGAAATGSPVAPPTSKAQRKALRRQERRRAAEEGSGVVWPASREACSAPGTPLASYPASEGSAVDVLTGERLLRAGSAQGTDESSGSGNSPCHGPRELAAAELARGALQRRVDALAALGFDPVAATVVVGRVAGLDARAALRALLSGVAATAPPESALALDLTARFAAAARRAAAASPVDWEDDGSCWPRGGMFLGEGRAALTLADWIGDGAGRAWAWNPSAPYAVPSPAALFAATTLRAPSPAAEPRAS